MVAAQVLRNILRVEDAPVQEAVLLTQEVALLRPNVVLRQNAVAVVHTLRNAAAVHRAVAIPLLRAVVHAAAILPVVAEVVHPVLQAVVAVGLPAAEDNEVLT